MPPKKTSYNDEKPSGKDHITCTPEKDRFLLLSFKKKMNQGHTSDGGLSALGWTDLTNEFCKEFKGCFDKQQLRNRIAKDKKEYKVYHSVRCFSGGGWDSMAGKVIETDEWWDDYVIGHSDAKPFQKKGFPNYDLIANVMPAKGNQLLGKNAKGTNLKRKQVHDPTSDELKLDDTEADEEDIAEKDRALNITEDVEPDIIVQASANDIANGSRAHIVMDEAETTDLNLPGNFFINPGTKVRSFGPPASQTSSTNPKLSIQHKRAASVKVMTDISEDEDRMPHPEHIWETGLKALACLVQSAVQQEKYCFSNEEALACVKKDVAIAKNEKYPNCWAAMTIFNATAEDHFGEPLACLAAAKFLFDEDHASHFVSLAEDLCWLWLRKMVEV
ncbi:hypothetical protein CROQUDRAFT_92485 [Cronartium quercuum f. sp. fusiforme G11]|uniref:Myb/SANT-like domain-containing protein n=1 Tax=Cronartium quercuum f. sp. fusiforme G11 TaxID=708437 RepID=A0A9P6NJB5_9BASI|nr:hypothetical protein CROQUDRAFT_92485 [Cronartium quercuum f. sp. fusiforme G11]